MMSAPKTIKSPVVLPTCLVARIQLKTDDTNADVLYCAYSQDVVSC